MRSAKIISAAGVILYAYLLIRPPLNVGILSEILKTFNKNISPIIVSMFWVSLVGFLLNLFFELYLFYRDSKFKKIQHATLISWLLLLIPVAISCTLYAVIANQIYNLS